MAAQMEGSGPVRAAMDLSAPWAAKFKRSRPGDSLDRAVVYVIGEEGGAWVKVGRTASIKDRLNSLAARHRSNLHMMFWMELPAHAAIRVESAALNRLCKIRPPILGREAFDLPADVAACAIVFSARRLGYKTARMAGLPGAMDASLSEVEEMLAQPMPMQPSNGRMDREFWSPQGRSFSG